MRIQNINQTIQALLDEAAQRTGLDDFGGKTFYEGLESLLCAVQDEADLNYRGNLLLDELLLQLLSNRLQVSDWVKRYPEILDEKVKRPLIILGLPRSGTTLLHHLLAIDPVNRFLRRWETNEPCPPPELLHRYEDPRIQKARQYSKWLLRIAPELKKINALNLSTGGPEECYKLLQHEFKSTTFSYYFGIPGYCKWFIQSNKRSAYEYHNLLLKLLQWRSPNERWILKAPVHLFGLRELLIQYPDAQLIFIHRNPMDSLASFISMFHTLQSTFTNMAATSDLAELALSLYSYIINNVLVKENSPAIKNRYDLRYDDLVKDPASSVKHIYRHFGLNTGSAYEQRMQVWLRNNPQHKHGKHVYSLESFGLQPQEVMEQLGVYQEWRS